MKVLVTYSSKTGNTKKLAEGIFAGIEVEEKVIMPMSEVTNIDEFDTVLVGYWVDKAAPNAEAAKFMESLSGKKVGIFATLAFWPDSDHAWQSLCNGEAIVKENNTVIGKYICQGKLDEKIIAMFEKMPADNPHAVTEEKRKRYEISKNHPTSADVVAAAELFKEKLMVYSGC
ncbi:flavodoxin family protein [Anaerosporobacter sp.]|uniref:flavodoxin family protein n=1 Tax=Anaerosporobacter sp. TaxID=1872529 RepID=UPI00286F5793|nr:flavodoxin family protein [Anaerosporobacter sp.]